MRLSDIKNCRGFTLAELLIVVAIIAVLVAISIPTMLNTLEKSKEAKELSELRNAYSLVMAAALDEASADYTDSSSPESSSLDWSKYIGKVIKSSDGTVCYCPVKIEQTKDGWQTNNNSESAPAIGNTNSTSAKMIEGFVKSHTYWYIEYNYDEMQAYLKAK